MLSVSYYIRYVHYTLFVLLINHTLMLYLTYHLELTIFIRNLFHYDKPTCKKYRLDFNVHIVKISKLLVCHVL